MKKFAKMEAMKLEKITPRRSFTASEFTPQKRWLEGSDPASCLGPGHFSGGDFC